MKWILPFSFDRAWRGVLGCLAVGVVSLLLVVVPPPVALSLPEQPPEMEADEEADWQALGEARRDYLNERDDETLEGLIEAAKHYLDGAPEPGRRTEIALGLLLQALERVERFAEIVELCDEWEPALAEQDTFRIALRVYRGKAHAHLGNVEEATEAAQQLRRMRVDEDELARFVQHALYEIERTLKLRPGSEPPAFELARLDDEDGPTVKSEHLLGPTRDDDDAAETEETGRHVLLLFWASWCGKCRELIAEELVALHERYAEQPFELVSVGLNWRDAAGAQREVVEETGAEWLHLYDETTEVASDYGVRHVPFLLLVDPDGQTVHAGTAFRVMDRIRDTLAEAFDEEEDRDDDDNEEDDDEDNEASSD